MTTIITKNGSGAPTAGQLSQGELAVDLTNKELYTKDSGGNVIKVGAQGGSTGTFTDLTATSSFTSPGIDDNANATAITIDANENVGIGLSSGIDRKLHVEKNDDYAAKFGGTSGGDFAIEIGQSGPNGSPGFNATSGSMKFSIANTERMRIDSAGNVGIGTAAPSRNLEVSTTTGDAGARVTNNSGFFEIQKNAGDGYINLADVGFMSFRNGVNGDQERMRIDTSGRVGIGQSSPSTYTGAGAPSLVIGDHTGFEGVTVASSTTGTGNFAFSDGTSGVEQYRGLLRYDHTEDSMQFWTNSVRRVSIDSAGNVGIGTNNPAFGSGSGLEVSRSGTATVRVARTGATASSGEFIAGNGKVAIGSTSNTDLEFRTNATERMRLDTSGNVLVGTTSAVSGTNAAKQYIFGNTASQSCLQVTAGSSHTGIYALGAFSTVASASGSNVALVVQSGNGSTVTANNFYVYTNGDVKNTNNSYGAISDARLKSNIVDASSQLDDIMAVKVRSYTLDSTGDKHIGVVAQELEEAGMDGLVRTDEEGIKSVKYSLLYMKAIKAMQEQQAMIETLQAEVAALKGA